MQTSYIQRLLQLPRRWPSPSPNKIQAYPSLSKPDGAGVTSSPSLAVSGFHGCCICIYGFQVPAKGHRSPARLGTEEWSRMKGAKGVASPRHREILPGLGSREENVSGGR